MKTGDAVVTVKINRWHSCPNCGGGGEIKLNSPLYMGMITTDYCPTCSGCGSVKFESVLEGIRQFANAVKRAFESATTAVAKLGPVFQNMEKANKHGCRK